MTYTAKNLATEIIKKEGDSRWNQKFYQPNNSFIIYVNDEKIDVTEKVNDLLIDGMFHSDRVREAYEEIRKAISKKKFDLMMAEEDVSVGLENFINNL